MHSLIAKICKAYMRKHANALHRAEHGMHCTYLATVAVFAHGPYAYSAGGLLVVMVLTLFVGEE